MAYNPFDDLIDTDPAYMSNGAGTETTNSKPKDLGYYSNMFKGREQPTTEDVTRSVMEKAIEPIFGKMYGIRAANVDQGDLDTAKKNKEIFKNFEQQGVAFEGTPPLKGSQEYYDMVNQILPNLMEQGYDQQSALKRIQIFLYGEPKLALDKIGSGADYYDDLDDSERAAINPFFLMLDALEAVPIVGLPFTAAKLGIKASPAFLNSAKKLLDRGVDKKQIAMTLKKDFPNDYKNLLGGSGLPQKPPGMETSQVLSKADDGTGSGGIKLNRGSPESYNLRFHSPWMQEAERIMKKSKNPVTATQIANDLKKSGFNIEPSNIKKWIGIGTNVRDKSVIPKFKDVNFDDMIRDQKVQAVKDLVADLKANPEKQGKGIMNYTYTIPYQDQTKKVTDIFSKKKNRPSLTEELGEDLTNELRSLTIKKSEGKTYQLYTSYFDQSNKRIYQSPILEKRNKAQDAVFQAFRDGSFGKNANFIEVMDSIGMQKIEGLTGGAKKEILQQNEEKLIQVNEYLKTFKDSKDIEMYNKVFDDSVKLTEYALPKWRETVMNSPELQKILIKEFQKFDPEATNLDSIISRSGKNFSGHVSHIAQLADFAGPQKDFLKGMRGLGGVGRLVRVNYGVENLPLQRTSENVIKKGVARINVLNKKKNLSNKEQDELFNIISNISYYNNLLKKKGMAAYIRMDKNVLTDEIINQINNYTKARGGPDGSPSNQIIAGNIKNVDEKGNQIKDNISGKYNDIFVGSEKPFSLEQQKARFDDLMQFYTQNPEEFSISMKPPEYSATFVEGVEETPFAQKGFPNIGKKRIEEETLFNKGGPVKMAIGGDPLENLNEQQFASDPATDDDFFKQAVQDENLMAFNPLNLFKVFKQTPAVSTPNKVVGSVATDAPTGTLPAATKIDMDDFPFQSHFINTISDRNIPNMDTPQGWRNLFGGTKGFSDAELKDSGILGYLEDAEKFLPGAKVSKEDLLKVYEKSPIANLEIKVKTEGFIPGEPEDFKIYTGSAKHKNMGNAAIDEGGTDYRNIVINVKEIPGQEKPFFNQGHFDKDPNVLAFTRVANYKNATGDDVAVIQELQTDLITNLRKEQERIKATVSAVRNKKQNYLDTLERFPNDTYIKQELDKLNAKYPEEKLKFLESTDLTRPADPVFLDQLAPELVTNLNAIQDQINNILAQNRGRLVNPNYMDQIKKLQDEGLVLFNRLFDLNRQKNFDDMLQGTFVTDAYEAGRIEEIGRGTFVPNDRPVETFGQIPFGKGPDWIDLMLKATIQDAQSRGINKVAIMPSDIVNKRWNKDADGSAGEKFQTIYDKISVQELKNIAKKYTGNKANLKIEEIVDPNKGQQGFRVLNKGVNGEYEKLKELDPNTTFPNRGPEDTSEYNYDILRLAQDYEFGEVIIRKEIAPGQSMDYAIKINKDGSQYKEDTFELVPAKEDVSPQLIIEEFNPSVTKMYVLTLPEETTKKGPMFLFRKKDGGKIKSDGLVSITDIYGDY